MSSRSRDDRVQPRSGGRFFSRRVHKENGCEKKYSEVFSRYPVALADSGFCSRARRRTWRRSSRKSQPAHEPGYRERYQWEGALLQPWLLRMPRLQRRNGPSVRRKLEFQSRDRREFHPFPPRPCERRTGNAFNQHAELSRKQFERQTGERYLRLHPDIQKQRAAAAEHSRFE